MRILALTNLYPNPYQADRATFNRQQLRRLAVRHAVSVIAPILWTDELAARRRVGRRLGPGRTWTCDGIAVQHPRYVYPPKVLRGWYGRCFLHSVRPAFDRALSEFGPDLVFAPWAYPDGWAAVELGRRAGLPAVVKLHGSDIHGLARHPRRSRGTREALLGADAVVAVSRDLADRALALGVEPGRVRVVYDGVDERVFRAGPAREAREALGLGDPGPLLLFVGNLVPVKGLDLLLDACALLAAAGERFTCLLIGRGPLAGTLARRAGRLGLGDRVRLLGPVAHDRLGDWYRAADLFVLPSRSEGVPVVLLEAMACGTPVVASRVGGIPEVAHLGESTLVPPEDPGALARAIRDRLRARDLPAAPRAIRGHAEAAAELEELLEGALRARRHRGRALAGCTPAG